MVMDRRDMPWRPRDHERFVASRPPIIQSYPPIRHREQTFGGARTVRPANNFSKSLANLYGIYMSPSIRARIDQCKNTFTPWCDGGSGECVAHQCSLAPMCAKAQGIIRSVKDVLDEIRIKHRMLHMFFESRDSGAE